ncbi:hypothetical protein Tco_1457750 [Tanacetum coccineum]
MAKPILKNAQEQNPGEPRDESNVKITLSKELLTKLQNNTFSGRSEEDVIEHIGKILEILDLVKIVGVEPFQLRMKSFHLSLSKGAKEWFERWGGDWLGGCLLCCDRFWVDCEKGSRCIDLGMPCERCLIVRSRDMRYLTNVEDLQLRMD